MLLVCMNQPYFPETSPSFQLTWPRRNSSEKSTFYLPCTPTPLTSEHWNHVWTRLIGGSAEGGGRGGYRQGGWHDQEDPGRDGGPGAVSAGQGRRAWGPQVLAHRQAWPGWGGPPEDRGTHRQCTRESCMGLRTFHPLLYPLSFCFILHNFWSSLLFFWFCYSLLSSVSFFV